MLNPKAAVPVLLVSFVFCLVVDNGFKFMSKPIADDLGLTAATVSLQATLAGIVIGIGAVVYAALADAISIKKLLYVGIGFIVAGSLLGFLFRDNWPLVLTGRIVQTCGLAAAETLYVIYVTKYLSKKDQKTYLGFSTSAFQAALLIGALTSGFIATYVSWTAMFLVPLLLVVTVPFIHKTIPETAVSKTSLDVIGLFLIAAVATCVILYTQAWNPVWLVPIVVGIALFVLHIRRNPKALVRPEFFTNGRYVWALILVLIVYSVQLAYIFLFPFAVSTLHGLELDQASLLIAPGYAAAAIVGALSGKIGNYLTSRQTIMVALGLIIASLILGALFVETSKTMLIISIVFFAVSFALLYAPLVSTAIGNIPAEKSGIAIGFYNLTINLAIPVGIAYTAKLMDMKVAFFQGLSLATTAEGGHFATVLWIIALVAIAGTSAYVVADQKMKAGEKRTAVAGR
ncbi:MFS transporter [Corynebacterium choanae]